MTNEQLLELLGDTDETLLEKAGVGAIDLDLMRNEADELVQECAEAVHVPKRRRWIGIVAAAACLTLCVGVGVHTLSRNETQPGMSGIETNLPKIPFEGVAVGSMGFEAMKFYDISELKSGNPWYADADLETLPVYQNYYRYEYGEEYAEADYERMLSLLMETAEIAGIAQEELHITESFENFGAASREQIAEKYIGTEEELNEYIANSRLRDIFSTNEAGDIIITADAYFRTNISYMSPPSMPEWGGSDDVYDVYCMAAQYFEETYLDRFGFEDPVLSIEGGDYDIYGEQSYDIWFYDGSGDLTEQILSYNFDRIQFFYELEPDYHFMIDKLNIDRTHKLGDYPILTPEEAEKMLLNGEYLTTIPEEYLPETIGVEKVELIYRTGEDERYYMPYYRFYIPVNNIKDGCEPDGTRHYGAFYVPAVEPQYLETVEVWDESFN